MLEKLPASVGQALYQRRAGLEALLGEVLDTTREDAADVDTAHADAHAAATHAHADTPHADTHADAAHDDATHRHSFIKLTSPAFVDNSPIPVRFTADGEGFSPPLEWRNVPAEAESLALIVEDADSPTSEPLVHAIVVDIDPRSRALLEGEIASERADMALGIGRNSYLRRAWLPPDPPPGHGLHRYAFQLFALTRGERFSRAPGRSELARAIRERAVASGRLIGTYERLAESQA